MDFKPPVAWLGGRDLIANIKYFLLFAISSGKLDLRDWMEPDVFPSDARLGDGSLKEYWKKYQPQASDGEFWFDYVADSGDGMKATFSLGYLMLCDLEIDGEKVRVLDTPESKNETAKGVLARRGAFLFVGGDTTYHVADYGSLFARFARPLRVAAEQYCEHSRKALVDLQTRPIFAIPGNHDYYDELDGFNRQFRKPITAEDKFLDLHGRNLFPLLKIPGYERFQSTSYVALRLPFDWWFWGLDCEIKRLDLRQQEFFKALRDSSGKVPEKIIVATPEPTTVEGKRSPVTEKTARAFVDVRLTQPFLYLAGAPDAVPDANAAAADAAGEAGSAVKARLEEEKRLELNGFKCRLDISGDTHHYARYWGRGEQTDKSSIPANYASVVSGGGGAAMSPTQVDVGEIRAAVKFPDPSISARVVNDKLFNPLSVIKGGNVWAAGAVIAILLYIAAAMNGPHALFLDYMVGSVQPLHDLLSTPLIQVIGAIRLPAFALLGVGLIVFAILFAKALFSRLSKTYDLAYNFETNKTPEDTPRDLFSDLLRQIRGESVLEEKTSITVYSWIFFICGCLLTVALASRVLLTRILPFVSTELISWTEGGLFVLSLGMGLAALRAGRRSYQGVLEIGEKSLDAGTRQKVVEIYELLRPYVVGKYVDYLPFWGLSVLGSAWLALAIREFYLTGYPWEIGQAFFFGLGVSAVAALLIGGTYYSSWLFEQSYRIQISTFSYGPVIVYNILAGFVLAAMIWLGGVGALRTIVIDVTTLVIVLGSFAGLLVLAYKGNRRTTGSSKALFLAFGAWHVILQLGTPLTIVWLGGVPASLIAIGIILSLANPFSRRLLVAACVRTEGSDDGPSKNGWPRLGLTFIWLIVGSGFLVFPFVLGNLGVPLSYGFGSSTDNAFFAKLIGILLAGVTGALLSCFWLGWYFAIALLYDGHGNEAGSTARIEDYKQFIRFRLTENTLTAYVIGVDKVEKNGALLRPRLIDTIELGCRHGAGP